MTPVELHETRLVLKISKLIKRDFQGKHFFVKPHFFSMWLTFSRIYVAHLVDRPMESKSTDNNKNTNMLLAKVTHV